MTSHQIARKEAMETFRSRFDEIEKCSHQPAGDQARPHRRPPQRHRNPAESGRRRGLPFQTLETAQGDGRKS